MPTPVIEELSGPFGRAVVPELLKGFLKYDANSLCTLAGVYAAAGRAPEARRVIGRLLGLGANDYELEYGIAEAYGSLGDLDHTLVWLEKAFGERSGALLLMNLDPEFAPVRADPRFRGFTARVGLPPIQ